MFHGAVLDVFFPYCIQRLDDGRYILLNRDYKPLGIADGAHVDYKAHPSATAIRGLTPGVIRQISFKGDEAAEKIYLYNDGCKPEGGGEHWDAYAARLKILAGLLLPG